MRLLLDANLSWRLVERLGGLFEACFHVDSIGIPIPAKDIEIWNYAKQHNLIVVSNDEDFLNLADRLGFPPQIILLRTGNQSTQAVERILKEKYNEIEEFYRHGQQGCLEIV